MEDQELVCVREGNARTVEKVYSEKITKEAQAMKARIGGQTVDLEIEGRVGSGVKSRQGVGQQVMHGETPSLQRRRNNREAESLTNGMAVRSRLETTQSSPPHSFTFTLSGQIRGGKNNMKVRRNGKHYPDKTFAKWRDEAVTRVSLQLLDSRLPIPLFHKPLVLEIEVHYAAGDLRRRDIPGMLDALFHVLERAQVIEDDAQIQEAHWYQLPVNREHPSVKVTVKERIGRYEIRSA